MDSNQIEQVFQVALNALKEVASNEDAMPSDRVAASKVLLDAVSAQYDAQRKAAITHTALPLLKRTMRSLAGDLTEEDTFSPVFELAPAEQANFVLQLCKAVEK